MDNSGTSNISDEVIFSKIGELMTNLERDKKLQEIALSNGLDVKNTIRLTDDTIENLVVSIIALLIAKRSGDEDYAELVRVGIKHRSLKTEIINRYKDQANQMIQTYKNGINN